LHCRDRYRTHPPSTSTDSIEAAPNLWSDVSVLRVHRGVMASTTASIVRLLGRDGPLVPLPPPPLPPASATPPCSWCHIASVTGWSMSRRRTAYPTVPKKHMAVTSAMLTAFMPEPRARDATDSNESRPLREEEGDGIDSSLADPTWTRKQNSVRSATATSISGPTSPFPLL
jgi:hypothetical protein